ncbi:UbiA family prenyltransferase [Saccharopolyspora sp. ASAGF58]|uniref:UbiA family prenyltransferase n=1 Tax=Saccharopolyspora sp. ASAGF58 TaxID=2719023 RepID=UPI001B30DB76|nr:UbiA family prenyltransferase [Saccharopolyspora sp. ASAGF58]
MPMWKARRALLAHLETWRPYTSTYVGLVSLAGAALSPGHSTGWRLAGAWAVPTLGWLAGLYGGDYFDRKLDAIAKPHRPIPSGRMRARTALLCMILCVATGSTLGLLLNWRTIFLVAVALAVGVSYNSWFKARGLSGNLVRGCLTAFAFFFGVMATSNYPPLTMIPLAAMFWLHDSGSNLVGALRDVDGDRAGGYQTLPVRHGVPVSLACAASLYVLWLGLALCAPLLLPRSGYMAGYLAFLGIAAVLGALALLLIRRAPRPITRRVALRAHEILVIERVILACALLFLGTQASLAALLGVVAVAVTGVAQHLMRRRYEFAPSDLAVSPDLGGVARP